MIQKLWKIIKSILFLILTVGVILGATVVTLPKIPDFYKEDEWDVVFFGTSQSYCTFFPTIFDEYGLKTYNRGRQQQTMNYTYYYIKDALDTSKIDVVVLETFGMMYDEGDERFTDFNVRESSLGDFRYSPIKIEAVYDCVPEEFQGGYLMPLDKYHTNWENWDFTSFERMKETIISPYYQEISDRGFKRWSTAEWFDFYSESLNQNYYEKVYEENFRYLELILEVCKEHNAKLVLVRSPLPCYEEVVGKMNSVREWADLNAVEMIDFMYLTEEIDLNQETDSLDGGVHLNISGASKVSAYLAEYLQQNYF